MNCSVKCQWSNTEMDSLVEISEKMKHHCLTSTAYTDKYAAQLIRHPDTVGKQSVQATLCDKPQTNMNAL